MSAGSPPAFGHTSPTFGGANSSRASGGEPSRFGASTSSGRPEFKKAEDAPKRFGSSNGGSTGTGRSEFKKGEEGPKRFGAAGDPHSGGFGAHGGEMAHRGVERDMVGHRFMYHGHAYAPFRAARYGWPRGYRYERFAIGRRLPDAFFVPRYYILDYETYGVEVPPAGFQWIRYGPDLLLVDLSSGQVINVVNGVFEESADMGDPALDGVQ